MYQVVKANLFFSLYCRDLQLVNGLQLEFLHVVCFMLRTKAVLMC